MAGRKWLVRGLVFSVLSGLGLAGYLYQRWTNPTAVRQQVIAHLTSQLNGVNVNLGSARLRLLGGIAIEELRLSRRDDRDGTEFAYVPFAILYHDKEQLLDGRLVIRKMELLRPRLHVIRRPDGTLNLTGLLGRTPPPELLPTVVIQQGTLVLEDQLASPGTPPVEIRNVNLTLINDPQPVVTARAEATCDLTEALQIVATWHRDTGEVAASLDAPAVPVRLGLIERLAGYCRKVGEHARQLEGTARVHLQVGYYPDASVPWSHDLAIQLTDGELRHPQLPLTLSHLKATARCQDGRVTLENCSADSGDTRMELSGSADRLAEDADFRGTLTVRRLPLCEAFFERLPATLQKLQRDFHPVGPVDLTVAFGRKAGEWHRHCVVEPVDMTATYERFHYPLEHLTGKLDLEIDPGQLRDELVVDLHGYAAGQPVAIKGTVRGSGRQADINLDIRGNNVPIDETLVHALPQEKVDFQRVARAFNAAGQVDFVATVRRPSGAEKFANRYVIRFHDAAMRYEVFPYPLEGVTGVLDIQPDHWEFHDFRGTHKGCLVRVAGRSHQGPDHDRLIIDIDGTSVLLDAELERACSEKLKQTWKTFVPSGRIDFVTQVTCLPERPQPDIDLTVTARDCAIRPTFFPCRLEGIEGSLRYVGGRVALGEFRARHGETAITLKKGIVDINPDGGFRAWLTDLTGAQVVPDPEFLHALPPALQKIYTTLELRDPIAFRTQLIIDSAPERLAPPAVWWDSVVAFNNARARAGVQLSGVTGEVGSKGMYDGRELGGVTINALLQQVTVFGQPFQDVTGYFQIDKDKPDILFSPGLSAHLYGGDVGGPVRVEFGSTTRYDLNLTALGIRLEEFGRQNNLGAGAQVSGLAKARLWLHGEGDSLRNLQGEGSLDVPSGRMYNLPLLLDLLKVPGLRVPDRTAFEEAHATFAIRGPRVNVTRVDLFGNAISLSGKGEMNLDGTDINLDFYAVWGRVVQMLPPVLDKIPPAISKQLLKIKMRGKIGDVHCIREPVPVVVEPLHDLFQKMAGRQKAREPDGGR
jgi:hypothetical protein